MNQISSVYLEQRDFAQPWIGRVCQWESYNDNPNEKTAVKRWSVELPPLSVMPSFASHPCIKVSQHSTQLGQIYSTQGVEKYFRPKVRFFWEQAKFHKSYTFTVVRVLEQNGGCELHGPESFRPGLIDQRFLFTNFMRWIAL